MKTVLSYFPMVFIFGCFGQKGKSNSFTPHWLDVEVICAWFYSMLKLFLYHVSGYRMCPMLHQELMKILLKYTRMYF